VQRNFKPDPAFAEVISCAVRSERNKLFQYPQGGVVCREPFLATTTADAAARNQVYNVAVGDRTTLNTLFRLLRDNLAAHGVSPEVQPVHRDFRAGDVRHSQADIGKVQRLLGYAPTHQLAEGVAEAMAWYVGLEK
jgi:UDP-N-acetylglucosamine 4-epimerase